MKPENISMVALTLFQQLFILGLSDELRSERADVIGMDNLWKIALRANDTEVSMAAIQYINTYYMEHQLKNEKEFVAQCMSYLTQAAEGLNRFGFNSYPIVIKILMFCFILVLKLKKSP